MKRIMTIAAIAASIFAVSCAKQDLKPSEEGAMHVIHATAGQRANTKTSLEETADGYKFYWESGDMVTVYQKAESGLTYQQVSLGGHSETATFDITFPKVDPQPLDYFALYPAGFGEIVDTDSGEKKFRAWIPQVQTLSSTTFDSSADLMITRTIHKDAQPEKLDFEFGRMGAILKLNITRINDMIPIRNVMLETDAPIAGYVIYDPDNSTYAQDTYAKTDRDKYGTPVASPSISLMFAGRSPSLMPGSGGITTVWFRTFPAELRKFRVVVTLSNNTVYSRRVDIDAHDGATPVVLADGKMTELTVDVSKTPLTAEAIALIPAEDFPMTAGEIRQMEYVLTPLEAADQVTWSSSDPGVAKVDSYGLVTAISKGEAIVTCTAGSASASVKVTVAEDIAEAVDLGLPSGTKWSSWNLGGHKASDAGNYYSWGDPVAHSSFVGSEYKFWSDWQNGKLSKYTFDGLYSAGTPDYKMYLEAEDDPATAHWGSEWRTPTAADFEELKANCKISEDTVDGVKVLRLTSKKNSNSIIIPLAGDHSWMTNIIREKGQVARFWTSQTLPMYCLESDPYSDDNACSTDASSNVGEKGVVHDGYLSQRYIENRGRYAVTYDLENGGAGWDFAPYYRTRHFHGYSVRPVQGGSVPAFTPDFYINPVTNVTSTTAEITGTITMEEKNVGGYITMHEYFANYSDQRLGEAKLKGIAREGDSLNGTIDELKPGTTYHVTLYYKRSAVHLQTKEVLSSTDWFAVNRVTFTTK